jgi:DNA-binding response OmpR family regulator
MRSKVYFLLFILFVIFSVLGVYLWKKRHQPADDDSNILKIGAYRFDKRNMELSFKNKIIELSSKEADLLFLLHSSANTTLERDVILRIVWGDEGDYVGRTLDVFISKLRKKLEEDAAVRIVNIRGIGYKLILND